MILNYKIYSKNYIYKVLDKNSEKPKRAVFEIFYVENPQTSVYGLSTVFS